MRTAFQAWMRASALVAVSWQALGATACSQAKDAAPPLLPDCDAGTKCGTSGGSSGGGGTPRDGGGGEACGVIGFPATACNACVKARCCARNATCSDNPDCLEVRRCIGTCAVGDSTCVLRCRDRTQNGVVDYDNFSDCVTIGCSTDCAAMDAGRSCGVLVFGNNAACGTCTDANCCTEARTCSNDPDCIALAQCTKPCSGDPVCLSDCQMLHLIGASAYQAVSQCVQGSCAAQCQ